jgi:hypothetical protein
VASERRRDTDHDDNEHNDTRHDGIQHNGIEHNFSIASIECREAE